MAEHDNTQPGVRKIILNAFFMNQPSYVAPGKTTMLLPWVGGIWISPPDAN